MWLFSTKGFYSVVQVEGAKDMFLLRARARQDIANLFPTIKKRRIIEKGSRNADYRFRIQITKEDLKKITASIIDELDYTNFKRKISTCNEQRDKMEAYNEIWFAMYSFQESKRLCTDF